MSCKDVSWSDVGGTVPAMVITDVNKYTVDDI